MQSVKSFTVYATAPRSDYKNRPVTLSSSFDSLAGTMDIVPVPPNCQMLDSRGSDAISANKARESFDKGRSSKFDH